MTYSRPSKGFPKHSYFCGWYYRFEENGKTLLELDSPNAAFEYEY